MQNEQDIKPADLASVYKEIAEVIGIDATLALHARFQGMQVTFPKKLYTQTYILQQVDSSGTTTNIKSLAIKFGYTERRLRQIIRENNQEN